MDTTTPWLENNTNIACHHATRLHTRRISIWDEYVCKLKVTRCLSGYTFSTSQVLDLALLSFASVTISSFSLSTVGCTSCPSASHWPTLMRDDEWKDRVDQHRPPSSYDSLKWTRLVQESNHLGGIILPPIKQWQPQRPTNKLPSGRKTGADLPLLLPPIKKLEKASTRMSHKVVNEIPSPPVSATTLYFSP